MRRPKLLPRAKTRPTGPLPFSREALPHCCATAMLVCFQFPQQAKHFSPTWSLCFWFPWPVTLSLHPHPPLLFIPQLKTYLREAFSQPPIYGVGHLLLYYSISLITLLPICNLLLCALSPLECKLYKVTRASILTGKY